MTPKHNKRAVNRRARQNKAPNQDMNVQDSMLQSSKTDSLTWNVSAGECPRFGNTGRFDNKIFNVEQLFDQTTILTSSTSNTYAALYWTASADIAQFSSFAAIFDQYRIESVEVWIQPCQSLGPYISAGTTDLYSVVDYDDANTPSSLTSLLQYRNCIVTSASNGHYRKFKPHIAMAAFSGAFTSYVNAKDQWIDCGSGGVQHYGVKVGLEATPSAGQINVTCKVRLWVQFRNVF